MPYKDIALHKEAILLKGRRAKLRLRYGLRLEEVEEMVKGQNGLCAICKRPETAKDRKNLAIDHDHATGKVRALLCHRCNTAIGKFNESIELLEEAVKYLRKHKEK